MTPDRARRLAGSLDDVARHLTAVDRANGTDPAPEVERTRRLLTQISADLTRHASTTRRLDDEIDLTSRRRHDPTHLADLRRRHRRAQDALAAAVDGATRALIPGGDVLDPITILRRLTGTRGTTSYFGRGPVDRADRLRRLTTHLLRPRPLATPVPGPAPAPPPRVPSPAARLTRIRRLVGAARPDRHLTGDHA